MDKDIFSRLYNVLVRSHLEYGNVVWSPHLKRQSLQIESIQRRAIRLVPECREMDYNQRLRYLKLYSWKGRQERGDLIQVYEIFKGYDDIKPNDIFSLATCTKTRNQGNKLQLSYNKTDMRKFSFANRVVYK